MGLASLPGKLDEYLDLERDGLTALELDVKDENGQIGFHVAVPLAGRSGATRDYYSRARGREARARARHLPHRTHRRLRGPGPVARARPTSRSGGPTARCGGTPPGSAGRTRTTGACGTTTSTSPSRPREPASTRSCSTTCGSPRTVTSTAPCTARTARWRNARRFRRSSATPASTRAPRRPHLGGRVRAVGGTRPRNRPASEAHGAAPRHGVRDDVSVAVRPGELGLAEPSAAPGATVARALRRFESRSGAGCARRPVGAGLQLHASRTTSRRYARRSTLRGSAGAKGYMLWNAEGVYTDGALAPR